MQINYKIMFFFNLYKYMYNCEETVLLMYNIKLPCSLIYERTKMAQAFRIFIITEYS